MRTYARRTVESNRIITADSNRISKLRRSLLKAHRFIAEIQRLRTDDITLVLLQNRLRWYEHVLRKDDDWVEKCMEYEVEGPRPRGRPKKTWRKVVEKDCQARKLNNNYYNKHICIAS